jgi:creatinine amidohydrolase
MMPKVAAGDRTASLLFLAEALKAEDTGKRTSTREMTETGIWSQADVAGANAAAGKLSSEALVEATVKFIEDWKRLRPLQPLAERSPSAAAAAKMK